MTDKTAKPGLPLNSFEILLIYSLAGIGVGVSIEYLIGLGTIPGAILMFCWIAYLGQRR